LKVSDDSSVAPTNLSNLATKQAPVSSLFTRTSDPVIALALFILCLVTRFIAIPASLWEWDDILFARALHKFDLIAHSPHPPGFPVFVAMARAAYWISGDEHRALTTVSFIFAALLAPALFYFYREVFADRRIAFAAALLSIFVPNVWLMGGQGRSDGVAFSLGIIGLALVLRGIRSQRSLIAGCAAFGLALGVRVTVLPVLAPIIAMVFLIRLRRGEWRSVVAGLAAGTLCVLVWFVPLIYHVTWPTYRLAMNGHRNYWLGNDPIFAPHHLSFRLFNYRVRRFFEHMWGARWIMYTVYLFCLLGLTALVSRREWKSIGRMALAFIPYLLFTFTLNAPISGVLYSLPYVPLFTGLAACGLILGPRLIFPSGRGKILENSGLPLALCLTFVIAGWTYPAVGLLHREVTPPARAFAYLKKNLDPEKDILFYDRQFASYAWFYLPNQRSVLREETQDLLTNLIWSTDTDLPHIVSLTSDPIPGVEGEHFSWISSELGAKHLSKPSMERFSGAHVMRLAKPPGVAYLSGWYQPEAKNREVWRWMNLKGKVALYRFAESMALRLRGSIVDPPNPESRPTLVFRLNGREVSRSTFTGSEIDHQFTVNPNPELSWSILELEIDQRVVPRGRFKRNSSELGLKCFAIEWSPAPGAQIINTPPGKYLVSGWSELEHDRTNYWRWASGSSIAHLPAIAGEGRLALKLAVPAGDESKRELRVEVDGIVLEQFRPPQGDFLKSYEVPQSLHRGEKLKLKLSLPNDEAKAKGIRIHYLGWQPSEKN
jgi:Dolichyl-phosphate-mannose-protein mannosyltransferase